MTTAILEAAALSVQVALLCVLIAVPTALVLVGAAKSQRRSLLLESLLLLPLFLPPTVVGFTLLWLLSPTHLLGQALRSVGFDIVFTPWGTLVACLVVSFPLAFQACRVGVSQVPAQIMEGGTVLGGSARLNTVRLLWPQMRGAVGVACLLVFARTLGEFGASLMVGGNIENRTRTLPLAIYSFAESGNFRAAFVAATVSAALGLFTYLLLRWGEK